MIPKPIKVGMEDGRRIIYQDGNKIVFATKEARQGGIVKTRRRKSIEFIPIDMLDNDGGLLEKDVIYIDGNFEWQRGIVIARMGSMLFIRKKELFDGVDLDRKEKVPLENIMGVVKEGSNGSGY